VNVPEIGLDQPLAVARDAQNNLFITILGRLLAICLSPIAFAILLTLYVFKYGFVLFRILIDEVNFYFRKWIESSRKTKELLDEFLIHKIIPALKWLFKNLLEENVIWEGSRLRSNWTLQLISSFLGQFYFIIGILLILISTSSFIYFIDTIGIKRDYTFAWILRMGLLLPAVHRYIRYKWEQKPFSWKSENNRSGAYSFNWNKVGFVILALLVIFLLIGVYCLWFENYLISSIITYICNPIIAGRLLNNHIFLNYKKQYYFQYVYK
jgi:hypothetical protein